MRRTISAFVILAAAIFGPALRSALRSAAPAGAVPSRSFEFKYVVRVPALPADGGEMRIWIPLPQSDAHQRISDLHISSSIPYRITHEPMYGNSTAYFQFDSTRARVPFDITLSFHARRFEYKVSLPSGDPVPPGGAFPPDIASFLQPDKLIPLNGIIAELSQEHTAGLTDPLAKARSIYDYIVKTLHYDHLGTGWGRGDAIYACTAKHGNCTDFHSLFIGMARAAGIPARFEIGFPLPLDQHAGKIAGYHCWAEFYINGIGWIPIDASEASVDRSKQNYFFGAVDQNRVRFSRGRDLVLSPAQAGETVNYIVYPYAELAGKPYTALGHEFSFRDVSVRATR